MPSNLKLILSFVHPYQQADLSFSSLCENSFKRRIILTQKARNDGIINAALNWQKYANSLRICLHGGQTFYYDREFISLPHYFSKLKGGKGRISMKPNEKKLAGIVLRALFIGAGFITFGCSGTKAPKGEAVKPEPVKVVCCCREDYGHKYARARELFESRHYAEAIPVFEELLANYEKKDYVDNCHYWIGESYYGMSKYEQAAVEFRKVIALEQANKHLDALLKLGMCEMQMGKRQDGCRTLITLIRNHPNSKQSNVAANCLEKAFSGDPTHQSSTNSKLAQNGKKSARPPSCNDRIAEFANK
jgi:tol-pal system protein YbgF